MNSFFNLFLCQRYSSNAYKYLKNDSKPKLEPENVYKAKSQMKLIVYVREDGILGALSY
jgi:hypothetical protein